MRNSLVIPLAIAIGCGTIAAVGVTHAMRNKDTSGAVATSEILVAVQDLDLGDEIVADSVRLEKWPADRLPIDATNDLKQVEGKFVNQRLFAGEPVLMKKLNQTNDSTTARIPQGFRAVTLDLKGDPGLAYLVQPGHRADVMGFFEKDDVIRETCIRTVLSDVRIFAVDGETVRGEEQEGARKPAKTVSLLIREEDQEAWTWAEQLGKLRLSLRNERSSASEASGPNQAGQQFVGWIRELEEKRKVEPKQPVVAVPQAPVADVEAWRMEIWTPDGAQVYQWREGNRVAELLDPAAQNKQSTKKAADLSYLNGSQSPFFEEPQPGGTDQPQPVATDELDSSADKEPIELK